MEEIKISVIVPIYNTAKYLPECLDSLLAQTLKDIEIIMIDDGSTDNSFSIANDYCINDERFILKHTENRGLSAARNAGMSIAKGEYLYFLDSDDYLACAALETLYNRAIEDDLEILRFSAYVFGDGTKDYIWRYWQKDFGYKYHGEYVGVYTGRDIFKRFIELDDYYPSSCLAIAKRNFLMKNGLFFYEGILNEDHLFYFETMMSANRISVLNKPLYYRRVRQGSIMKSDQWLKKISSMSTIIKRIDEHISANKEFEDAGKWIILLLFNTMVEHRNEMKCFEQYSNPTKNAFSSIKPIVLRYNKSKRNRLFFYSFTLYKIYVRIRRIMMFDKDQQATR